jgi:CRP-like cAMP-binding protein
VTSANGLGKFVALDELLPEERETLAEYLEPLAFGDGEPLFRENEESDALLFLHQGRVKLSRAGRLLGVLGAGEVIGGLGLVLIGRRQLEACAEGDVVALALTRARYVRLRLDEPAIALKLLEGVFGGFAAAVRSMIAAR